MIEYKILDKHNKKQFNQLLNEIETSLTSKDWWLPITQTSYDKFFDSNSTFALGVFDNNKLVALSCLFIDEYFYLDNVKSIKPMPNSKFAGIGRCMVSPNYRGNDYMYKINSRLCETAKNLGYTHLICTVHPDNIASYKSLKKLGMIKQTQILKYDKYIRDILVLDLYNV